MFWLNYYDFCEMQREFLHIRLFCTFAMHLRYLFKLFSSLINWKSTKQKLVTKSLTKAKLVALLYTSTKIF
jgi:hypothetical protein